MIFMREQLVNIFLFIHVVSVALPNHIDAYGHFRVRRNNLDEDENIDRRQCCGPYGHFRVKRGKHGTGTDPPVFPLPQVPSSVKTRAPVTIDDPIESRSPITNAPIASMLTSKPTQRRIATNAPTRAPQTQAPQTRAPQTPAPQTPAPQTRAPQTPAPQTSAPQSPYPQSPAPQTPAPQSRTSFFGGRPFGSKPLPPRSPTSSPTPYPTATLTHEPSEKPISEEKNEVSNGECTRRRLHADDPFRSLMVYEWPQTGWDKTQIKVINSMCSSRWKEYFADAIHEWNLSTVIDIEKFKWSSNKCNRSLQYVEGFVNVVDGWYPKEEWEGFTTWEYYINDDNTLRMKNALVILNNFHLMNDDNPASYDANRHQTLCHEIGHALGLDHHNEDHYNHNTGSCMDYSAVPEGGVKDGIDFGPANTQPNKMDFWLLYRAYKDKSNRMLKPVKKSNNVDVDQAVRAQTKNNDENKHKYHFLDEKTTTMTKMDFGHLGSLISETRCKGTFERGFRKVDEDRGILTVSLITGVDSADSR